MTSLLKALCRNCACARILGCRSKCGCCECDTTLGDDMRVHKQNMGTESLKLHRLAEMVEHMAENKAKAVSENLDRVAQTVERVAMTEQPTPFVHVLQDMVNAITPDLSPRTSGDMSPLTRLGEAISDTAELFIPEQVKQVKKMTESHTIHTPSSESDNEVDKLSSSSK